MSKEDFYIGHSNGAALPTRSALAETLKNGELARHVVDWAMVALCSLGLYFVTQSQLEHEIESSTLPQKKTVKESSTPQSFKMDLLTTQRSNEYEVWADLKDLIERKKPSSGYCHIQLMQLRQKRTPKASKGSPFNAPVPKPGYELACWAYSSKKAPANHSGTEILLDLQVMGAGGNTNADSGLTHTEEGSSEGQTLALKAHAVSPSTQQIRPEGWIETPTGILRFDAKEERWK